MPRKLNPKSQCTHRSTVGRRCHMLLAPDHPALCAFHARAELKAMTARDREVVAVELLSGIEALHTPASVNLFLANLLKQVARNRIPRKNAIAMAYISQLLLNSISVMHREARDAKLDAQAAKAAEPETIILNIPRPCRRRHVDDSDDDHDPTHANGASHQHVHSNANNDNGRGAPNAATTNANVKTGNNVNAPAVQLNKDAQTNKEDQPASADPNPAPTPAAPNTPIAPTTPPQHPGKELAPPDDPDPSTQRPLPAPWGTRAYGFSPVARRRRWPRSAHRSSPSARRAKVFRESADHPLGLVCVLAPATRLASGGQGAMAKWLLLPEVAAREEVRLR